MGAVERWNNLAKKKLYINDTWEIRVGRLMFMIILNIFIMFGMIFSGATAEVIMWLWVDMIGSLESKHRIQNEIKKGIQDQTNKS